MLRVLLVLGAFALGGCAAGEVRHADFPVPSHAAFDAAAAACGELGLGIAESDATTGHLTTVWRERDSNKTQGGLLVKANYRERQRLHVSTRVMGPEQSRVRIITQRQERPPAGRRAMRWTPIRSDGEQAQSLLDSIRGELERGRAAEPPSSTNEQKS